MAHVLMAHSPAVGDISLVLPYVALGVSGALVIGVIIAWVIVARRKKDAAPNAASQPNETPPDAEAKD